MPKKQDPPISIRPTREEREQLDELVGALTRERAGSGARASVNEAVRTGIREAFERRAAQITADRKAWAALVERAGSETTMLTLHGEGQGEHLLGERTEGTTPDGKRVVHRTPPPRWASLKVTAALDGKPADLPLIVEEPPLSALHFDVYLTDAENKARIYLGPLQREVQDHPAFYDNRLFRIASEVGLG